MSGKIHWQAQKMQTKNTELKKDVFCETLTAE